MKEYQICKGDLSADRYWVFRLRPLDPRDGVSESTGRAQRRIHDVPQNETPNSDRIAEGGQSTKTLDALDLNLLSELRRLNRFSLISSITHIRCRGHCFQFSNRFFRHV